MIPFVGSRTRRDLCEGIPGALEYIVAHDHITNRSDQVRPIDIACVCPTCVVIDQHDPIGIISEFDASTSKVGERRTQHPGGSLCDRSHGYTDETPVNGVVPKALIDAGAFRLQSIVADMMDIVVVNIGIKRKFGILQGPGRASVDAIEEVMHIVVAHDCADMTSDDDSRALHETAFDCRPGPFIHQWIINFVPFDTRIIALVVATVPIDENPQLHIVNFVLADQDMRGVDRAYATAVGCCPIEPDFKSLYPNPVMSSDIECMVKTRDLPQMAGGIIQAAYIESLRA